MRSRWINGALWAGVALAVAGCGSSQDIEAMKGVLTYEGQPVPDMIVRFAPEEGRASEGKTGTDGSFEMCYAMDQMGVEPGSHRVTVDWSPPTDEIGLRPDPLAQKVLDDFRKNGPISATIDGNQSNFEIKLPR